MRKGWLVLVGLIVVGLGWGRMSTQAATGFATPMFQQQWATGEAITPNFWGPLANATDAKQEPYKEATGGQRTIQYFDKARMELTNGTLTNGLLTVELMTGNLQRGDATFDKRVPARINVAGDPGSDGVTYADLAALPYKPGRAYLCTAMPCQETEDRGTPIAPLFAAFVDKVGVAAVGLPITGPFVSNIAIAGVRQQVWAQAFERRVLTLAADAQSGTSPSYRIEFGNIGQHYYQWRYAPGTPTLSTPLSATATATAPAPTTPPTKPSATAAPIRDGVPPTNAASCPIIYPVKGVTQNGTKTADIPGSPTYFGAKPEICFISPADADAAGYHTKKP